MFVTMYHTLWVWDGSHYSASLIDSRGLSWHYEASSLLQYIYGFRGIHVWTWGLPCLNISLHVWLVWFLLVTFWGFRVWIVGLSCLVFRLPCLIYGVFSFKFWGFHGRVSELLCFRFLFDFSDFQVQFSRFPSLSFGASVYKFWHLHVWVDRFFIVEFLGLPLFELMDVYVWVLGFTCLNW